MDDGTPALEVGFAIETGGSFDELMRLQQVMDSTEGKAVANAARIEKATAGMVSVGGATAQISSFGNAITKEAQVAVREFARIEKAGESMVRSIDRQSATFGKTRDEIRSLRAEEAALAAERVGNADLAVRIRASEAALYDQEFAAARRASQAANAAAEDKAIAAQRGEAAAAQEAAAIRMAGAAAERAAREHGQLAAMVRGSHDAQVADAVAAERLRMSTDPLYAATKRLNDEIAESTRLYYAGATSQTEYSRQQEVLTGRLNDTIRMQSAVRGALGGVGETGKLTGYHMQNLAFQFQDVGIQMAAAAGSSQPFKMAMMAVLQQGGQIQMIMSQAGVGIRAVGAAFLGMAKSMLLAVVTNPVLLAIAAAATAAAVAVKLLNTSANNGADMKEYAKSLGLTEKQIRGMDNVTVTYGDTVKAVFQVAGRAIWGTIGPAVTKLWDTTKSFYGWLGSVTKTVINGFIGYYVGAFNVITKTWRNLPAVMGAVFYSAVNASIGAINTLVQKAVEGINFLGKQANRILPDFLQIPELSAPQIDKVNNQYAGAFAKFGKTAKGEMTKAFGVDYVGNAGKAIGKAVVDQAQQNARDRIRAQAEKKGYLDDKPDRHAEQLARDAEATEAQIRNLYKLADAYQVSGAAALIAEARVKAESKAIKQRADIEAAVDRQVRLAIAQRVSDAAKNTASVRDQATAQEQVNALVAAGLVPAQRANDLVQDRMADLPLLAALEAAQQRGLKTEADRATAALADQRVERERAKKAATDAQFNADHASAEDQLEMLRKELSLVSATNGERAIELATLKAIQEARTKYATDPAQAAAYVEDQRKIAIQTEQNRQKIDDYNASLTFTADQWDLIARNVDNAARGMADAFGRAGDALGGLAATFADFRAEQARADAEHIQKMKEAGSAEAKANEIARHSLATATSQVGLYGDMTVAAKGFFKEGSSGYKALETAEKAFRAVEFALSVRAMAQDAIETASSIAKSGARTATKAVEAVVSAISSLPFPLNLAAGAATIAALASIGVAIAGAFGGGGKSSQPKANDGTGTVFGDATAKSESIKRSIDALKDVDTLTSIYARDMMASLRSIDSQIAGFANLVLRAGDVNASAGVNTGFKTDATGKVLSHIIDPTGLMSKIPIIGGVFGAINSVIKSLFGTKTSVVGSGLFGDAQSLGSILGGGFDAQYFSDIQKKKKFFGLTTGTSYSTQYSAADPALENQFTLILRAFNDAIASAAGPLGVATSDIQNRLNSFVVNIGKIDLQGLTGTEVEEKLTAVFGAAADSMANAAFPGLQRFQQVGEGAFETLVRVASTVEAVTTSFDQLGFASNAFGVDIKMAVADQFDSVNAMTSAVQTYFEAFYTPAEQTAAKVAQLGKVFDHLGFAVPPTLDAFRALVSAQDLTTEAGRSVYATLIQLAPAFADLKASMEGAKSAADILAERQDLERSLLELQGNTAALRALELAKLDPSNRALQQQIYAIQDAQAAAQAADQLRQAWQSVGDSIMDEVKRIRGLTSGSDSGGFATLMGQFNAATSAARAGDQDIAKTLPGLSQALIQAAARQATSRQELDRVQAQIAASLETTYGTIAAIAGSGSAGSTTDTLGAAATAAQASTASTGDPMAFEIRSLRDEVAKLRQENNAGHAANAGNTGAIRRKLDDVTAASGGDAIATVAV